MIVYLDPALALSWVFAQIVLGILFADLMSGIVHWYIDTYGDPDTPVLGRHVYHPTINHHAEPLDCIRASFWSRNGPLCGLMSVFIAGFLLLGWINAFTLSAIFAGVFASEIHVWSHKPKRMRPVLVRWLQNRKIILTPREHWLHHTGGFNQRYCTITNLLNPLIDRLRLFRLVEGFIEGVARRRPRDEIMGIGPLARGRRALSRARRFVAAACWQVRKAFARPIIAQPV